MARPQSTRGLDLSMYMATPRNRVTTKHPIPVLESRAIGGKHAAARVPRVIRTAAHGIVIACYEFKWLRVAKDCADLTQLSAAYGPVDALHNSAHYLLSWVSIAPHQWAHDGAARLGRRGQGSTRWDHTGATRCGPCEMQFKSHGLAVYWRKP
jgi:hypothetical protein